MRKSKLTAENTEVEPLPVAVHSVFSVVRIQGLGFRLRATPEQTTRKRSDEGRRRRRATRRCDRRAGPRVRAAAPPTAFGASKTGSAEPRCALALAADRVSTSCTRPPRNPRLPGHEIRENRSRAASTCRLRRLAHCIEGTRPLRPAPGGGAREPRADLALLGPRPLHPTPAAERRLGSESRRTSSRRSQSGVPGNGRVFASECMANACLL